MKHLRLIVPVADGKCMIDLSQTSYPSHVNDMNLFAAGTIIQSQCVEKGSPSTPPWGGQAVDIGHFPSGSTSIQEFSERSFDINLLI